MLTRTIYRQNEQPAQVNYIWLTTRLQHLTLDALKNGLYSMLENNNENIESFQGCYYRRDAHGRRLSHLAY
ncbi:hypothetical protein LNO88_00410 [Klebsiella pneumoniae subsp. pneumoniae]|nr:hypothetical protein [Klebsiella pneumoniae subsp. pneumoniae]